MKNEFVKGKKLNAVYAADNRRDGYDLMNHQIVESGITPDILFIGDSITENWETSVYFKEYGYIVNRGIGGDTVFGLSNRFDVDAVQLKPKRCVLMIGINDIYKYDCLVPCYQRLYDNYDKVFEDIDNDFDAFFAEYSNIFDKAKAANFDMIVCSVLPVSHPLSIGRDYRNYYVNKLNKNLKALTEKYGFVFADMNGMLQNKTGQMNMDFSWDGVHPTGKGYDIMVRELKKVLAKA